MNNSNLPGHVFPTLQPHRNTNTHCQRHATFCYAAPQVRPCIKKVNITYPNKNLYKKFVYKVWSFVSLELLPCVLSSYEGRFNRPV